jgi:hypothetical protein
MRSNIWSLSKQKHSNQEKSLETYKEQIIVAKITKKWEFKIPKILYIAGLHRNLNLISKINDF